ncbi:hypothetical protein EDB85DRAFT_1889322 [Lactarius pseudohatsudake]|nr:hypothetical protein EDB85DRAFT_1889322 [Lactarius pseudohatsudake]
MSERSRIVVPRPRCRSSENWNWYPLYPVVLELRRVTVLKYSVSQLPHTRKHSIILPRYLAVGIGKSSTRRKDIARTHALLTWWRTGHVGRTVFWTDFYDVNHIRRSSLTGVVALRRKQPARFQTRDTSVADNESQYSPRDQVLTSTWGQSTSMRQIEPGEGSEKRGRGCSRSFGVTDAKAPCSQGVQISVFRFLGAASPAALRDDGEGDAVPCTENMKFVRSDIPDDQKTTGVIV